MITKDQKKLLSKFITELTGLTHIYTYHGAKVPETAFYSSRIASNSVIGKTETVYFRNDADEPMEGSRTYEEGTWYIQGTGEGVTDKLRQFCRDIRMRDHIARLQREIGITITESMAVQDITEQRGSDYVERCACDLKVKMFGFASKKINEIISVKL